jgi:von Willebrand factor type A C-terminal domain/von Willebrand factor type A domain
VRALARALSRAVALAAVLVWRAVTPVGHLVAALAKGATWLIVGAGRLLGQGLSVVVRALARALSRAVALAAGLVWRAVTPVGHLVAALAKGATTFIGSGVVQVARTVMALLRPSLSRANGMMKWLGRPVAAAALVPVRMARTLRWSSGRVVQGSLVAFGTARHQARLGPRTGTTVMFELSNEMDQSDDVDDRPPMAVFTAASQQNPYLPSGRSLVEAIVSVTADVETIDGRPREAVEIFLLDCSGSMGHPWDKIRALRKATRAALEILPDGVWFAVVRGAETAEVVYPPANGLVEASPATRKEAVAALAALQPVGGTAIGRWLALAARLSSLRPGAIHHTLLLTDGKDEDETERELDAAVAACVGRLQCDCRGIGSDWAVSELRKISSALLGSVDIIRQPADMEGDFRAIIDAALARQVEGTLRVWVPERANVKFIRQVSPTIEDMTARARVIDGRTLEIPTGAWTTENREYHICIEVPPGHLGAEMLASRVSVMVGDRKVAQALVKASWTDDASLSAPISLDVAHYTDQAELARAIQEGLEARRAGHEQLATDKLGRAVQLAARSGRHATSQLLADVVDVQDATTGRVQLKAHVEDADEMALDARSTRTNRVKDGLPVGSGTQ